VSHPHISLPHGFKHTNMSWLKHSTTDPHLTHFFKTGSSWFDANLRASSACARSSLICGASCSSAWQMHGQVWWAAGCGVEGSERAWCRDCVTGVTASAIPAACLASYVCMHPTGPYSLGGMMPRPQRCPPTLFHQYGCQGHMCNRARKAK
jgi:hypothetical protein